MKVCPKCKSKDITENVYGLISESGMKTLEKELKAGKIRLGGCCICEGSKRFVCNICFYEWERP